MLSKPYLIDVVRRQERGDVNVERQQIPDGVGVLGAVQPVERLGPARVRSERAAYVSISDSSQAASVS